MLTKLRQARRVLQKPVYERTLSEKVMVSGALTGIEHATSLFFRLGSTLIVTRLLAPEVFGLFAIVITFQYILSMITDFGVRSLIIVSDKPEDPEFLRTCWSVQLVRGAVLWVGVAVLGLTIYGLQQAQVFIPESAFGHASLPAAIAVTGGQLLLMGLQSVNQHVYAYQMRFRMITIMNVATSALGPAFTITIAFFHPTIWALVISGLLSAAVRVVLTFSLFDGPSMRWCWAQKHVSELWKRGRWIMSHSTLSAATNQADSLLFGAFMPASLLGMYFLAKQIVSVIPAVIVKMQGAIALQLFKEMLGSQATEDMRNRYYRYRLPIDAVFCLLAGGAIMAGPALIDLMYDPRYLPTGTIILILALGLPLTGMSLIRDAFSAQKRFKLMAGLSLVQTASIWLGLLIAMVVFENQTAAFVVVAFHRAPELILLLFFARKEEWISLRREFFWLPLIGVGTLLGWGFSELYFSLKST